MLYKNNLVKGLVNVDWDFEDGLCFKLSKNFFLLEDDAFVICTYIAPYNSTRSDIFTGPDAFDILEDKICNLKMLGNVFILGDLNSRTGTRNDVNI